jgi:hypothetical protein
MVRIAGGIALLALAGVLLVAGVALAILRRRGARRLDKPRRIMNIVRMPSDGFPYGLVDIPGRVENAPGIVTPLSRRPCSLWELTLFAERLDEDGRRYYVPIWVTGRSGDLVLSWEQSRERLPDRTVDGLGPGSVSIAGSLVHVVFPPPPEEPVPMLSSLVDSYQPLPDVGLLEELGLPAELAAQARARPTGYRVAEGTVSTGEFLRLFQRPLAPPASAPDPAQPFQVVGASQEAIMAGAAGCLAPMLLIGAIVIGAIGLTLLAVRS